MTVNQSDSGRIQPAYDFKSMQRAVMRQWFKMRMLPWMTLWEIWFLNFLWLKTVCCSSQNKSTNIQQKHTVHQVLHRSRVAALTLTTPKSKGCCTYIVNSLKPSNYNLYFQSMQHLTKHWNGKGKVRCYSRFVIFTAVRSICLSVSWEISAAARVHHCLKMWSCDLGLVFAICFVYNWASLSEPVL